ncbi:MAG: hypothetical protein K9M75_08145 [Phycisphaerae bacterium]|nr:hypothetical protein [Phycisphaerae bacterium]
MKKHRQVYLVVLLSLLFAQAVCFGWWGKKPAKDIPDHWPEKLDKRKLYIYDNTFIYSGSNSEADKIDKLVRKVIKEFSSDKSQSIRPGLIIVMDVKEKTLFDMEKLLQIVKTAEITDSNDATQAQLDSFNESLSKTKKEIAKLGLSLDNILAMAPIPLETGMLPQITDGFDEGFDKNIGWCMIIPTERHMKAGVNNMIDAVFKAKKVGGLTRVIAAPFLPGAVNKAVNEIKQACQLALFELILSKQKNLTKLQKQQAVEAYEKKIGINKNNGKNNNDDVKSENKLPVDRKTHPDNGEK